MKTEKMKWLRLELQSEKQLSSLYVIFHTHYAMFSYLQEQGFTAKIFQPHNTRDEAVVLYVQTDHQGFFESCLKNYSRDFNISGMAPDFQPSPNYEVMFGADDHFKQVIGAN